MTVAFDAKYEEAYSLWEYMHPINIILCIWRACVCVCMSDHSQERLEHVISVQLNEGL